MEKLVVDPVVQNLTVWIITVHFEEPVRYLILTDRLLQRDCYLHHLVCNNFHAKITILDSNLNLCFSVW